MSLKGYIVRGNELSPLVRCILHEARTFRLQVKISPSILSLFLPLSSSFSFSSIFFSSVFFSDKFSPPPLPDPFHPFPHHPLPLASLLSPPSSTSSFLPYPILPLSYPYPAQHPVVFHKGVEHKNLWLSTFVHIIHVVCRLHNIRIYFDCFHSFYFYFMVFIFFLMVAFWDHFISCECLLFIFLLF